MRKLLVSSLMAIVIFLDGSPVDESASTSAGRGSCPKPVFDSLIELVENERWYDNFKEDVRKFKINLDGITQSRRREYLPAVTVWRGRVFRDSFRQLFHVNPKDLLGDDAISIQFIGEPDIRGIRGTHVGDGPRREWYSSLFREIFSPNLALFTATSDNTYVIDPCSSEDDLDKFRFVGRMIAKAAADDAQGGFYFARSFYAQILGQQRVDCENLKADDPQFYHSLIQVKHSEEARNGLTFTVNAHCPDGPREWKLKKFRSSAPVNKNNAKEYVQLVCAMKLRGMIKKQLNAFLQGFYDVIPQKLISPFNEEKLALLISGSPKINLDDLEATADVTGDDKMAKWFWKALRSFSRKELANFLQEVTGSPLAPLDGFTKRPLSISFFNDFITKPFIRICTSYLRLPSFESYDKMREVLLALSSFAGQHLNHQ